MNEARRRGITSILPIIKIQWNPSVVDSHRVLPFVLWCLREKSFFFKHTAPGLRSMAHYCHTPTAVQSHADERGRSSLPATVHLTRTDYPNVPNLRTACFQEAGRARCPHRAALRGLPSLPSASLRPCVRTSSSLIQKRRFGTLTISATKE